MNDTIWKFQFSVDDEFILPMPKDAKILSAQNQSGLNCIWAIVIPDAAQENRTFRVYGTGHPFNNDLATLEFISTIQDGALVWHLFEVK